MTAWCPNDNLYSMSFGYVKILEGMESQHHTLSNVHIISDHVTYEHSALLKFLS